MTAAPSDLDLQELWQARPKAPAPITLAEIHARALAFHRQAGRRRLVSWVVTAAALAGLWFARYFTGWMMQLGCVWTLLAVIVVMWRWRRVNALEPPPGEGEALMRAYRSGLVRLREARRTVLLWRIAPLLPGLALVFLGRWSQLHAKGLPVQVDHWILLATMAAAGVGFGLGYLRHQRRARELQRMIDELDRGRGG